VELSIAASRIAAMLRALALCLLLPSAALAESFAFDVTLAGVRVASMTVDGEETAKTYRAAAQVVTRGLAGAVRPVRWDAAVNGARKGARLMPSSFREEVDTGRRQTSVRLAWKGGAPAVQAYDSSEAIEVAAADPAAQKGTVDPLTALYAGLRPVAPDAACGLAYEVFDGQRRTSVALSTPLPVEGGGVECAGTYRRIAGFPASDLAERPRFAFRVTYLPRPGGLLHVDRIETDTLFGRAVLRRRWN
jgi:Protein of unknown function (DUF3108)